MVVFAVALKFGVGIAIIIVAHMVLVKKWNQTGRYFFLSSSVLLIMTPQLKLVMHRLPEL